MTDNKLAKVLGLSAAIVVGSLGIAAASETVGVRSAYLYAGPGTSYQVIDRLHRGDDVRVVRQRGPWCYVRVDGPDGWLKCGLLVADNSYDDGYYGDDYGPNVTFQFGFGGFSPRPWMHGQPHGPMGGNPNDPPHHMPPPPHN